MGQGTQIAELIAHQEDVYEKPLIVRTSDGLKVRSVLDEVPSREIGSQSPFWYNKNSKRMLQLHRGAAAGGETADDITLSALFPSPLMVSLTCSLASWPLSKASVTLDRPTCDVYCNGSVGLQQIIL